ncbi:MAG TPA: glycosyltransferase family 4 protein [Chloroflexota bacterium]|nr:glycosyltransferase family 4 protein [Chloroflexota bacterium]
MLSPDDTQFAIVSFEGPDQYARAGGLAVRVRDLSLALAQLGYRTHLFFLGDPALPAREEQGRLVLHRWCQPESARFPGGVYDGEWEKLRVLEESLPPVLADEIVRGAADRGAITIIMGEDWQTASTMIRSARLLDEAGLTHHAVPVWTANNLYGFEAIDLPALDLAVTILTVSRYMKHRMQAFGLNPLVTPNGIAPGSLVQVPAGERQRLRTAFSSDVALFKIGRFSPDKRWLMAMDAVALLNRDAGSARARLLIRGDRLPYGQEVLAHARAQGLSVAELPDRYGDVASLAAAVAAHPDADVLNLTSFLPDSLLPAIYAAVDGVLANSAHEPFGLVGLEVMAAGGLPFVGATGEDYAEPLRNSVVLDTDDPREIVVHLRRLLARPAEIEQLKRNGLATAQRYVWPAILEELFAKLEYAALTRGVARSKDVPV